MNENSEKKIIEVISEERKEKLKKDVVDYIVHKIADRLSMMMANTVEGTYVLNEILKLVNEQIRVVKTLTEVLKNNEDVYWKIKKLKEDKKIVNQSWILNITDTQLKEKHQIILSTGLGFVLNECSNCEKTELVWLTVSYKEKYSPENYCGECALSKVSELRKMCGCKDCPNQIAVEGVGKKLMVDFTNVALCKKD